MRRISQLSSLLFILNFPIFLAAQTKTEKRIQAAMAKMGYTAAVEPSKEYLDAELLANNAIKKLSAGEVNAADSLIRLSMDLYPTNAVFNYVKEICKMPDLKKANAIMDRLYEKVKSLPEEDILMQEPIASSFENGQMVAKIKPYEKERALFNFGFQTYKINKEFGTVKRVEKDIQKLLLLNITNKSSKTFFDFEYNQQEQFRIDLALLQKDFDKAISLTEQKPITAFYTKNSKDAMLAYIYQEKGDLQQALKISESLKGMYAAAGYKLQFGINALLGDNEKALKNYNEYLNEKASFVSNDLFYYLAIIDINKKDFTGALANLDSALHHKMGHFMEGMEVLFNDKWKVYKLRGDAYAGLKQYDKARDSYNISLLYNPDFESAIDGLSKLEVKYATETAADKTPPQITITEPFLTRGLKVTPAKEKVMVRGVAKDPSGLKEVSLNGKIIYSQQGGDFWGEVTLNAGLNKIEVQATDMAGNKAVQQFEIQKADQPIAQSDIIPVVETEGKNYALFVAAQNYADSAIPSLENPVADAVKLKLILKNNYNFADANIVSLFNPESNDLRRQLLELTNILQPEDKLVIFYAGHGIWVDKEKKGYWLLTDAKRNDTNTWLPNRDVLDLIAKIPARHTLLITDACFSGSVFKTRGLGEGAPVALQEMDNKISRVAITSGNDTEVPDESVFMKYLMKALSENKEKYLTAQKMFINQIIEAVMTESKTEPRYGTLESAGHVGGDFIFSRK